MQRAIARQAEAERERRAKIISADGEFQAAEKLAQAANIISPNPATLQLRYLQTLLDIGVNQNSTIIFPLPLDMIKPFLGLDCGRRPARPRARRRPGQAPSSPERSRGPHRPAHRAAGDPRARAGPSARTRSPRPAREREEDAAETCPFCEGREDRTPPEVWARPSRRRRAGLAGLDGAGGAEPLPGARRRRGGRAPATGSEPRAGARRRAWRARSTRCGAVDPGGRARPVRVAARRAAPTR